MYLIIRSDLMMGESAFYCTLPGLFNEAVFAVRLVFTAASSGLVRPSPSYRPGRFVWSASSRRSGWSVGGWARDQQVILRL